MEIGFNPAVNFRAGDLQATAKSSTSQSPVSSDIQSDTVVLSEKSEKKEKKSISF